MPQKHDGEKPRLDLIPPEVMRAMGRAFGFGARKYSAWNYAEGEGLEFGRLYGALLRHVTAWWDGEEADPESGLDHLDHAAASLAMLLYVRSRGGLDDRPTAVLP